MHYAGNLSLGGRLEHGMPDVPAGAVHALEGVMFTLLRMRHKQNREDESCKVPKPMPNPNFCK